MQAFTGSSWDVSLHLGATPPWCSGPSKARVKTKMHTDNSQYRSTFNLSLFQLHRVQTMDDVD